MKLPSKLLTALTLAAASVSTMPAQPQSAVWLIQLLTQPTEDQRLGTFSCGQFNAARRNAMALAAIGESALPEIETELDAIEANGPDSFGEEWVELAYAKIKGPAAYARLRNIDLAYPQLKPPSPNGGFWELERVSSWYKLDQAIALSRDLTSFVSVRPGIPIKAPYQCRDDNSSSSSLADEHGCPSGTHAEPLINIHCERRTEPLDGMDQFIRAFATRDQVGFDLNLGSKARAALESLLAHSIKTAQPPSDFAIGYRFENAGRWSEPADTLEYDRTPAESLANPVLETSFQTRTGKDCGKFKVEFLLDPGPSPPLTRYLVNNSDLGELLAVIGSCAGSE
jgi:hypothetical protein